MKPSAPRAPSRHAAHAQLRRQLERLSSPRLQMSLIVAVTGLAGWLASALLLGVFGVDAMAWRYPLAVGFAYLVFLALLWAWLRLDVWDVADLVVQGPGGMGRSGAGCAPSGGGGDFGGGGATASFAAPDAGLVEGWPGAVGDVVGEAASASLEADDGAIPLLALLVVAAMALGLVVTAAWLVQLAPVLFAELLLDGTLSYALYRRLDRQRRTDDRPHWLSTAVRRTAWPFVLTAVLMALTGVGLALSAPGAHSLGEVIARWRA